MKSSLIPITVGILSVGLFFVLYLKRRKRENQENSKQSNNEELEFQVNAQQVLSLVGRNSVVLKTIENETKTEIKFREIDGGRICCIKGNSEDVEIAKNLLDIELTKPFVITEELQVPTLSCGKIEGCSGSVLFEICSKSSAKVWVDPGSRKPNSETRRVLITGTAEQVEYAKKLIDEKIRDDESNQPQHELSNSNSSKNMSSSITSTDSPRDVMLPSSEKLTRTDGQIEVFVSTVNSPSQFYIQIAGTQSTELDFLVDAMTEYYSSKTNQEIHSIREPYLGQICAAMLLTDNRWYRAEIVAIDVNETVPQEMLIDVFFLDYGDRQFVTKKNILELRTDFLSLRFQAIECFLAHVRPQKVSDLGEWEEKTIEKFENLVKPSHWKKLTSKVVSYKPRTNVTNKRSTTRESSPVPGVELYECDEDRKNIAVELVKLGYAEVSDEQFGDLRKSSILLKPDTEKNVEDKMEVESDTKLRNSCLDLKPDVSIEFVLNDPVINTAADEVTNDESAVESEIDEIEEPSNLTTINPDSDESDDDETTVGNVKFTVSLPTLQQRRSPSKNLISSERNEYNNSEQIKNGKIDPNGNELSKLDKTTVPVVKSFNLDSGDDSGIKKSANKKKSDQNQKPEKLKNPKNSRTDWNEMLEDD